MIRFTNCQFSVKNTMYISTMVLLVAGILATPVYAGRIWFDGSVDDATDAPGKLLTGNEDYWGDVVLTGVTYTYEIEPDRPADNRPNRSGGIGGTLFNGNMGSGNIGTVGISAGRPLVVLFDFQRQCIFTEWDIIVPDGQVEIKLEIRKSAEEKWQQVYAVTYETSQDVKLYRIVLPNKPCGRFARLSVQAPKHSRLREVLAWGDVAESEQAPEVINPVAEGQYPVGIAYPTVTGVAKSSVSDRESFYWKESLTEQQRQKSAVWARVPTWSAISNQPIAPEPVSLNAPIEITMARNETEAVALVLRNTMVTQKQQVTVSMQQPVSTDGKSVEGILSRLGVMGVIGDRGFGNNLGPILYEDNMLGSSLMRKYLLNGAEIYDFPNVTLPPSGTAVFWLTVTTQNVLPGTYKMTLNCNDGVSLPVTINVLDVTLPSSFAFVKTYCSNKTRQFPFEYSDRADRDIAYALDCGISDWGDMYDDWDVLIRLSNHRSMKLLSGLGSLIPIKYTHMLHSRKLKTPSDFPGDIEQQITQSVSQMVQKAQAMGLDYHQWFGWLVDEPNRQNMAAVAEMCRLIKQANPKVNIYLNPCYWSGFDNGAVSDDQTVSRDLSIWYNKYIDISLPVFLMLNNRPRSQKIFTSPRMVNGYYYVSGHLDRSESAAEVQKYRRMPWDSFAMGMNGWAFYSWYSPRGSAWNHFDQSPPGQGFREPSDYQIVYPGPRGVIPTRQSEALREGWEDWRLLNLIKDRHQQAFLDQLYEEYHTGQTSLEDLRLKALKYIATFYATTN